MHYFICLIGLLIPFSLGAEVILDSTLGRSGNIAGESNGRGITFNIDQSLGQTVGQNLFHSFEQFNLPERFDVALFSGADDIRNIMARVTGGRSFINGTIRSPIPDVNFYLLNPHGVFFSEFASLDISGSFHVSTADTLYLGETGQFNASTPENSILTTAPPNAFGFLNDHPAGLTLQGKGLLLRGDNTRLSLVSGDIHVSTEGTNKVSTKLHATQQVSVASVSSKGIVSIDETGIQFSPDMTGGNIYIDNMKNKGAIDSGDVFIRGGNIVMSNTEFFAVNNKGSQGKMNIQGDDVVIESSFLSTGTNANGKLADISIQANNLTLSKQTTINTTPEVYGRQGGDIHLIAKDKLLMQDSMLKNNASAIRANTIGGETIINAGQFVMENAQIESVTPVSGTTKGIHIQADDINIDNSTLSTASNVIGNNNDTTLSLIGKQIYFGEGATLFAGSQYSGQAGDIHIAATEKLIIDGGFIFSGTAWGIESVPNNDFDIILNDPTLTDIEKRQKIEAIDNRIIPDKTGGFATGIAGNIYVETSELIIKNYGILDASVGNAGQAGSINIKADKINISNYGKITTQTDFVSEGHAGNINIQTKELTIQGEDATSDSWLIGQAGLFTKGFNRIEDHEINPDEPTGIFSHSTSNLTTAGDAGNISIKADKLVLQNKAYIASSATNANGGNVHIDTQDLVLLRGSEVSTNVKNLLIATTAELNAGNVVIENPEFVVMDEGQIITRAVQGTGGDITINAKQFLVSNQDLAINSTNGQNILNAASNVVERSGTVMTPQITEDVTKQLLTLTDALGQRLLSRNCLTRDIDVDGSFKIGNLAHYAVPPTQLHLANNLLSACLVKKQLKSSINLN